MMENFQTKIGLEIHCQLKTKSKMFCRCDNDSENAKPNTNVCSVCLGMPGTLPVANRQAIEWTIKTGIALGSKILKESKFDRKHYFYPDLPKGYQISQYDMPFCKGGELEIKMQETRNNNQTNLKSQISNLKTIRLNRIHLEEDAGKLTHPPGEKYSLVDLNRAGTPLMEIVTEPDISSPAEAKQVVEELRLILRYLGVSDADMEKGHLRCDANISVTNDEIRNPDDEKNPKAKMSPIVEIKNLNSFKFIEQALIFEEKRLQNDSESWPAEKTKITRGFDSKRGITFEQRRKEEASDYRYFPEPDLPPFNFSLDEIEKIKSTIPELPKEKVKRYVSTGIREDVAEKISKRHQLVEYLESSTDLKHDLAVFVVEEVPRIISEENITFSEYQERMPISKIADLINLVGSGTISKMVAKDVFVEMVRSGKIAIEIIKEKGLGQVSDHGEIEAAIAEVLRENPEIVKKFKLGKNQVVGFLVGQVMRKTSGKANPQVVNKLLAEKINGLSG